VSTVDEEREWWESKAPDLAGARAAIWDEPEPWRERIPGNVEQIVSGLRPVLVKDARILDLGCGVGDVTRTMSRRYPSVRFIGVDVSPAMLDLARAMSQTNIRWVRGDGRTLPRVGRLNGAWSVITFQHIPVEAQRGYVREVAYRLEPGGIFRFQWVTCPDAAFLSNGATEEQVRDWCEEAGFKVDTIEHGDRCDTWAWCTAVKP
jgi:trans-aconitate methyltransferase